MASTVFPSPSALASHPTIVGPSLADLPFPPVVLAAARFGRCAATVEKPRQQVLGALRRNSQPKRHADIVPKRLSGVPATASSQSAAEATSVAGNKVASRDMASGTSVLPVEPHAVSRTMGLDRLINGFTAATDLAADGVTIGSSKNALIDRGGDYIALATSYFSGTSNGSRMRGEWARESEREVERERELEMGVERERKSERDGERGMSTENGRSQDRVLASAGQEAEGFSGDHLWLQLRAEAREDAEAEPALASYINSTVLAHRSLESAMAAHMANKLSSPTLLSSHLFSLFRDILFNSPHICHAVRRDILAARARDPACVSLVHCMLNFKGFCALEVHRIAHHLWCCGRRGLALALQSRASEVFHVDIHPGASIGSGILLDHATGVVIGETAVVGDDVTMLHNVTLGGTMTMPPADPYSGSGSFPSPDAIAAALPWGIVQQRQKQHHAFPSGHHHHPYHHQHHHHHNGYGHYACADHHHHHCYGKQQLQQHPIVESGVFIGAGSRILGPVRVGRDAKVGAGSLVVSAVPAGATVVGSPAQELKRNRSRETEGSESREFLLDYTI